MSEEKRRFTRIPFSVHIEIISDNNTYITDKFENLAIGGCSVSINTDMQPGTSCDLKISLDHPSGNMEIHVKTEVVRNSGDSIALKFVKIDIESLNHLKNILLYNADDPESIEKEIKDHPGLL